MDNNFLDFGSGSDSDDEEDVAMKGLMNNEIGDSDDDDNNDALAKLLSLPTTKKNKEKIDMDDFEAEMEAELDKRAMEAEKEGGMEHQRSLSRSSSTSSLSAAGSRPTSVSNNDKSGLSIALPGDGKSVQKKSVHFAAEPPPPGTTDAKDLYDAIYFDSDESEGEDDEKKAKKRSKREFLSDDDLFYDPNSDAADQEWVNNKRRDYSSGKTETTSKGCSTSGESSSGRKDERSAVSRRRKPALSTTDAVLNCPACFTVLCLDCQRHEFYSGQYRAMFVMNCVTDKSETLIVPVKEPKSKKRDKSTVKVEAVKSVSESDKFFPVKCKICTTQVAVYDHDEVYHFFNVLASHP